MDKGEALKWGAWFFDHKDLDEWVEKTRKHKKIYYRDSVEDGYGVSRCLEELKNRGRLDKETEVSHVRRILAFAAAFAHFLDPSIDAPRALIEALQASKFELTRRARLGAWVSVLGFTAEGRPWEEYAKIVSPGCRWESDCEHLVEVLVKSDPTLEPITPQEAYDELEKRWRK